MTSNLIKNILGALNKEVINGLDLAKSIAHPGESGRAREQIIAEFFQRFLPKNFGISTGFVIDATGGISRQIDLIVYRNDYHPIFEIGGIKHFMVESVVAVMENKSSLASRERLGDALDNIESVKKLDRTNRGKNYTVIGSNVGSMVDHNLFKEQVFGAILTEESLTKETLKDELLGHLHSNPNKNHWFNFYADVRNLSAFYAITSKDPTELTAVPQNAEALAISSKTASNFVPPLIVLASELCNLLRVTPLIDYHTVDYLLPASGAIDWWKI